MEQKYQKKDHRQHVLDRPGMYVGTTDLVTETLFIMQDQQMVQKQIQYVPAFVKLFDEILVNAIDHSVRHPEVTKIQVSLQNDTIIVKNNGPGIPIKMHSQHQLWIPEMLFGHLLTSTNYDDTEQRVTGGMNGYGAKLTNVFSTKFTVTTCSEGQKYTQTWTNNMTQVSPPKITAAKSLKEFTEIAYSPDYTRFPRDLHDTFLVLARRVYDATACTGAHVQVTLNDETLKAKTLPQYVKYYLNHADDKVIHESNGAWDYAVVVHHDHTSFQPVSFVNGIYTSQGGKHVDHIANHIAKKLAASLTKYNVKPDFVKQRLFLFVRATVANPTFNSQTKECLVSPPGKWPVPTDAFMDKIAKSDLIKRIVEHANALFNDKLQKQTDGKKKNKIQVDKLDDAIWAGTAKSHLCTLILTEGDSAKTFAVSGVSSIKDGHHFFGIYPLRGKVLNVRTATQAQLLNNQEIVNLKTILGLKQAETYETNRDLRYGRVLLLTDADVDGSHIKGLLINFFHTWWPSLLKNNQFLCYFATPVVKATKGAQERLFYSSAEYDQWVKTKPATDHWKIKYYKGLGTSTPQEARAYFQNLSNLTVQYTWSDATDPLIELAFEKKNANARKTWLSQKRALDDHDYGIPANKRMSYDDFVNHELIHFSMADNVRSIPSVVDGLKVSQRKILFGCLKRSIKDEIKVAQLAAYVAEASAYHHGEVSLQEAIVCLAQDFVGSNNLNLLLPIGAFGSRLDGGHDAASARYIFTKLNPITQILFDPEDNPILSYHQDDGHPIEPVFYVPLLSMVLLNGASGIGTGFSTEIPSFSPKDVLQNTYKYLNNEPMLPMTPWYRGFLGRIERVSDNTFRCYGKYTYTRGTLEITELPVGVWTNAYKTFLEKTDYSFDNFSSDIAVRFVIKNVPDSVDIVRDFKLSRDILTSNMHAFDESGLIKKYETPQDIIMAHAVVRLQYYEKRKAHLLGVLQKDLGMLRSKSRFLEAVMSGTLLVFRQQHKAIIEQLSNQDYLKHENSYEYLINTPVHHFSKEKIDELEKTIAVKEAAYNTLMPKTAKDLFLSDLEVLAKRM